MAVDNALDKETVVAALDDEWAAIERLLSGLEEKDWFLDTCLPGWRVKDVAAHLVGTEALLSGEALPGSDLDVHELPHVRNEIGAMNELWVRDLADTPPAEVLARFRDVTASRLDALRAMPAEEYQAPCMTPAGQATYGRFMEIRTYDCWMHEQDIRGALGGAYDARDRPALQAALNETTYALGFVVGKRAAAPQGSTVLFDLTGPGGRRIAVAVEGRASVVPELDSPATATLRMPVLSYLLLCGGRTKHTNLPDIALEGDTDLAHRILTHLAFTI